MVMITMVMMMIIVVMMITMVIMIMTVKMMCVHDSASKHDYNGWIIFIMA